MSQNLAAAQIVPQGLRPSDRRDIEKMASTVKDGKTNWFQDGKQDLTPPREAAVERGGPGVVRLKWQTAYAGDEPIARYEIWRDHRPIGRVDYKPQTGKSPFVFEDTKAGPDARTYQIATVDMADRRALTTEMVVKAG